MDFFGDVFGTSASLFEGLNRVVGDGLSAREWFASKESDEAPVKLPWEASLPEELPYERQLREAVLLISQSPQIFLQDAPKAINELPADDFASAGAVLEADDGLRLLRFRLVPKYCSEEQFWSRYFAAVARVKQQVKTEQMWGDFDMLTEDDSLPQGNVASSSSSKHSGQGRQAQVDLPSARQATNATDTMSHMHAWGRSARRPQEGQGSAGKGREVAGQKVAPVRIQCKQAGLDQPAERMVMSGDLGSQASSITEALLMSPRSMSSTTTKAVTPATPGPLGPLAPPTRPSHLSPPSPFPLSPLSPGPSLSLAESARQEAHVRKLASNDSTLSHAGRSITSDAGMGAEQMQSDGGRADAVGATRGLEGSSGRALPELHVPFTAVPLQQLANAVLLSKKAHSMEEVVRQDGMSSTASGDRAATAAWRLFEPMQFGMSAQPKLSLAAAHDLAESIAGAMCEMTDCAGMAMFWTEVMQEVESHWTSGRPIPAGPAAPPATPTTLQTCFASIDAAIACRQQSGADAQVAAVDTVQQGSEAVATLKQLPPRAVFQDLFAVKAQATLSAAAAAAGCAADNDVLLSGVREVQRVTNAALSQPALSKSQPALSKSQLTKLCQVFKKLEVMFQVSVEQQGLKQQTQQQAGWIATASQQGMHACSPSSSCSSEGDPTWSDLGYESWTLL